MCANVKFELSCTVHMYTQWNHYMNKQTTSLLCSFIFSGIQYRFNEISYSCVSDRYDSNSPHTCSLT